MSFATKWRDDTHIALLNRPRTLTLDRIAMDTGLSRDWLAHFSAGKSKDPGICKVETLFNYLNRIEFKESDV